MAAALTAAPLLGGADLPPGCTPRANGLRVCMAQQVCTCHYDPAGTLTGRRPGWRWQCDILLMCDTDLPADLQPQAAAPPLGPIYIAPTLQPPAPQPSPPLRRP